MAWVITRLCRDCVDQACVDVCPVECIYEYTGDDRAKFPNQLYIHPEECIDCGACEPVCPTKAIFAESDLPEKWKEYKGLNAELAPKWPNINEKRAGLPEADSFKDKENKRALLDLSPGGK